MHRVTHIPQPAPFGYGLFASSMALAVLTLVAAAPAMARSLDGYVKGQGDLNGDGRVTRGDAALADRLVSQTGTVTPGQHAAVDANGDGSITIDDAAAAQEGSPET